MSFDPNKPIAEKTTGGFDVRNIHRRHDGKFGGELRNINETWVAMLWTENGCRVTGSGQYDLMNVTPDPAPVNWEEPIQFDDCDVKPDYIGDVISPDSRFHGLRAVAISSGKGLLLFNDNGEPADGEGARIINVPKPAKTVTVGVAERDGVLASVQLKDDGKFWFFPFEGAMCFWFQTIGDAENEDWHILIEPREVEVPE